MARYSLGKKINVNGTLDDLGNTVSDEDLEKIDSFVNSGIEEVVNAVAWNLNEGFYIAKGTLTIGANTYIIKNTTNPAITTSNGAVLIYVGKGVYVSSSAGTYKYLTIYNGYTSGTNELIVTFDFTQHGQIWLYDNGATGENFDKFPSRKQYSVVTNISVVNNRVRVLKDGQVSYLDDIALTSDIPTDYVTSEDALGTTPEVNPLDNYYTKTQSDTKFVAKEETTPIDITSSVVFTKTSGNSTMVVQNAYRVGNAIYITAVCSCTGNTSAGSNAWTGKINYTPKLASRGIGFNASRMLVLYIGTDGAVGVRAIDAVTSADSATISIIILV